MKCVSYDKVVITVLRDIFISHYFRPIRSYRSMGELKTGLNQRISSCFDKSKPVNYLFQV